MKKSIGKTLKNARKRNRLTIEDVQQFLSENEINSASKTIYGWENDFSMPNINIFLLLCKFYRIRDVLKTFGYDYSEHTKCISFNEKEYSKDELEDIQKYAEFIKLKRKN